MPATAAPGAPRSADRKSTRLNSSHTEIYTLSLHDALPICLQLGASSRVITRRASLAVSRTSNAGHGRPWSSAKCRSEEHTSELQSHRDLHSFPTRRSSDLLAVGRVVASDHSPGELGGVEDLECRPRPPLELREV